MKLLLGDTVRERTVQAPVHLNAQTRTAFREEALQAIDELGDREPGGLLVVDVSQTLRLDSAGLGTLVMLQLRASERRHTVRLRGASEELRFMLLMTRLDDRFDIEPAG